MVATILSSSSPPLTSVSKFFSDNSSLRLLHTHCTTMRDLKQIHADLIKTGVIKDTFAASRVLAFCASTAAASDMNYAYLVFTRIRKKNPFVWNAVIRGFSRSSFPEKSISVLVDMLEDSSVRPQRLTYPSVFKAYAALGWFSNGSQLHGRVIKEGLESDQFIRNTILYMYANCGCLDEAWRVFDGQIEFDVVAWNSMLMGLGKCGQIDDSRKLFDEMPQRNEISWNSMISGYVRNGRFTDALELFREMLDKKIKPSEFMMVSLLNACACLGARTQGKWIHDYVINNEFELDGIMVTTIIDMYCKCGCVEEGLKVFKNVSEKPLSSWNSMILGLANNGFEQEAITLFSELDKSNLEPDPVSFIAILTACIHSGMVQKAKQYFSSMIENYKIEPSIKHYSCFVDVLAGAGFLEEAENVIKSMPINPDAIIWSSLLSGCVKHGNIEMAERAAECVMKLNEDESCGYVLMSNAYSANGRFEEAIETRRPMRIKGVEKELGCSLIEVGCGVHEFVSNGIIHPETPEIYRLLQVLDWDARTSQFGLNIYNHFG